MNIVLLTQDEPFFLAENIDWLLNHLPEGAEVTGCVLFDASPFGERGSMFSKLLRTWRVFGTAFTFHYGLRYLNNRFRKKKKCPVYSAQAFGAGGRAGAERQRGVVPQDDCPA